MGQFRPRMSSQTAWQAAQFRELSAAIAQRLTEIAAYQETLVQMRESGHHLTALELVEAAMALHDLARIVGELQAEVRNLAAVGPATAAGEGHLRLVA